MARLVKARRPETDITIFYIDIQTFGKDFDTQLAQLKDQMTMVRAIPADIFGSAGDRLRVVYFNPGENRSCEALFDMVVLSVAITPSPDNRALTELFQLPTADTGFLEESEREGVFVAGAAGGPMSIAESVASAGRAAFRVASYLRGFK
jgi:heterodisulfide reductase subunit A